MSTPSPLAAPPLTARSVEALKPGPTRREIPDRHLPGLYLIIQPTGSKVWAVRYSIHGRSRKYTLGPYPAINLKDARELAARAIRAVAEGRDPGAEKAQTRNLPIDTVEAVAAQFVALHCRRTNRPRTIESTQTILDLHVLPAWKGRLLRQITRRDVISLIDGVVASGRPVAANRVLMVIRKLFNWAMTRDLIPASPCAGVTPPTPEVSRDRVLSDTELVAIWTAAETLGGPYGTLVQLLMLTGQRRDEVAGLTWSEIDRDGALWALPRERAKNGRPHSVPLSGPVLEILDGVPRIGTHYVLTTTGKSPSSNYGTNKRRLDALLPADMPHWQLHDLRRTFATAMARLGVNLPVVEKILNHTSGSFGGVAGIYQRHDFNDEKRHALELWGRYVTDLVRVPEARITDSADDVLPSPLIRFRSRVSA